MKTLLALLMFCTTFNAFAANSPWYTIESSQCASGSELTKVYMQDSPSTRLQIIDNNQRMMVQSVDGANGVLNRYYKLIPQKNNVFIALPSDYYENLNDSYAVVLDSNGSVSELLSHHDLETSAAGACGDGLSVKNWLVHDEFQDVMFDYW